MDIKMTAIRKSLILLAFMSAVFGAHIDEDGTKGGNTGDIHNIRGQLASLQSQMNRQQQTFSTLETKTKQQDEEYKKLEHTIQEQNQTIHKQSRQIQNLKQIVTSNPSQQYQQTNFGCLSEIITLYCYDGGVINVTDAYYGMYSEPCDGGECCMPDQVDDCRVSVQDNRLSDWFGLKVTCDNRTTCSYEYLGSVIDDCEQDYLADYMQIYYDCGIESGVNFDPVAFTAYSEYYQNCYQNVTAQFTGVINNVGNSYDEHTSSFTCPFRGVYLFSLSVKMQKDTYSNYLSIQRDGEIIAEVWADGDDISNLSTPSGVVVIECDVGEVIWISCGSSDDIYGSSGRESLFAGYMLYRYE